MRAVPGLLWAVRPVSACRLWQLALMLHAAGVGAFGTQELQRALATAHSDDNRGRHGNLDRRLLGAVPAVNNQTVVCPPPFFWLALPAPALACQSGSSRRCQKMHGPQGFGLGKGEALAAGARLRTEDHRDYEDQGTARARAARQDRSGGHPRFCTFFALLCMRPTPHSQLSV